MKIMVTGSSGTIGTRLVEKLLERGDEVIGVDWKENKWNPSINDITKQIDLRDKEKTLALPKADIVVHLAANARVYELVEDPSRARDNFETLFNILEYARTNGVKKFIFASSRESYGNFRRDKYSEDLVRIEHCESPYTASKVGGEALIHSYMNCYGIDAVIYRFSNVYGMYDDSERVIPLFIRLSKNDEPLTVFGKDKCLDFTYIDDNVDGVMLGIDKFDQVKGETFNLGNGQGTTILELAEKVIAMRGGKSEVKIGESRVGEVHHYIADISKAKKLLGYDPKTPFSEGIEKTYDWYVKNLNW